GFHRGMARFDAAGRPRQPSGPLTGHVLREPLPYSCWEPSSPDQLVRRAACVRNVTQRSQRATIARAPASTERGSARGAPVWDRDPGAVPAPGLDGWGPAAEI